LTLSPDAATGICPSLQPWAVGIFSVGRLPCGFATGTTGALPQAGSGAGPCRLRHRMAAAPIEATTRAKMPDKPMSFPCRSRAHYPTSTRLKTLSPAWRLAV
jgi:hypothetical protein